MGEVFCRFAKEKESHYGVSYAGVLGFQGICDGFAEEYFCLKNPNAVGFVSDARRGLKYGVICQLFVVKKRACLRICQGTLQNPTEIEYLSLRRCC